ncbi:galactose-1-phosphate uridylyltransferase [Paenibacillus hemerocallicola]|jgi:UDPglucose--hexose-1-phosphate uridylyltransferase|uniref:Galactose-1-phosphate uridylyltransferase n=1 Tax=Paenibacillus hemerocallicola TaxID=1172614 RepID=A0A5C4TEQ9_9BACL|nr:galactose-1-phosphate uridylyltransferase [Paenibacillus hemerocallicola]TNJ67445.1 galactose-1-phosphate uridylyltransferase [Paenibacillus hemerocallicola]
MAELRFNPLLRDWIMVASNRQNRPHMPKGYCPFCPGSGKVPDHYDVHVYENDFPALSPNPPEPDPVETTLYKAAKSYGKCEVVLYSPDHTRTLPELPVEHIGKLIDVWTERFVELSKDPRHQYVMIFENRGEECGVTMPHPHGQIYAYSHMPLKLKTELESCRIHHEENGSCLLCDMNKNEAEFRQRIVIENEHFLCYLPYFTDYPYGVFIVSKRHMTALPDFTADEKRSLAEMLKDTTGTMDQLFDKLFPYMMVLHQRPVNGDDVEPYYHFHIEFYPPLRDKDKIKWYASSEMGAWAAANPMAVEETAPRMREAYERYLRKEGRLG